MTDTGPGPAAGGASPRALRRYLTGALEEVRRTAVFSRTSRSGPTRPG